VRGTDMLHRFSPQLLYSLYPSRFVVRYVSTSLFGQHVTVIILIICILIFFEEPFFRHGSLVGENPVLLHRRAKVLLSQVFYIPHHATSDFNTDIFNLSYSPLKVLLSLLITGIDGITKNSIHFCHQTVSMA